MDVKVGGQRYILWWGWLGGKYLGCRRSVGSRLLPLMMANRWGGELVVDRVGISFKSTQSPDQLRRTYVQPLRAALELARAGIYSNYLRQADQNPNEPAEHLLVFEVNDFKAGLHLLRTEMEKIGPPEGMLLHNLNPSSPEY